MSACSANSSFRDLPRASRGSGQELWGPGPVRRLWACCSIIHEHALQCQLVQIARGTCRGCSRLLKAQSLCTMTELKLRGLGHQRRL